MTSHTIPPDHFSGHETLVSPSFRVALEQLTNQNSMDPKYYLPYIFAQIRSALEADLGEPDTIKNSELKAYLFSSALLL